MWKDERLTWDPTKFGGIDKLSVNSNQVNTSDESVAEGFSARLGL